MLCSDPMSGSHFIAQTSNFLVIDATAVTLGQGYGKVIQYISPDPYILCAKYLRSSSNGFDVRQKMLRRRTAEEAADAAETNWKHKVTPDWGDLITYLCDRDNQVPVLTCKLWHSRYIETYSSCTFTMSKYSVSHKCLYWHRADNLIYLVSECVKWNFPWIETVIVFAACL